MENNYFIIHGSFSSPFSNWIPYLRSELEKSGKVVYTPDLPSGVGLQNFESWSLMMDVYKDLNLINENTIIYAHSIAPVFIAKYLISNNLHIKRLISVCGFNNYLGIDADYDSVNESMYFDSLSDVKTHVDEIICLYSDNDPYVSMDVESDFAKQITDNIVIYPNGGHLNSEANYTEFPDLLKYI